jgi:DNA-binding NarL/FixJ family response regulator
MIDILVVDDNLQIRETLRAILETRPDFHVVGEATDGIAASQLAQTLRPQVVLMDVGMARMDGIEATRQIRAVLPGTVVIGMSCHSSRDVEATLLAVGAKAFIPKEDVPDRIFAVIARELAQQNSLSSGTH